MSLNREPNPLPDNSKDIFAFFYDSYELSQGDPDLQGYFFSLAHKLRPDWHLSDEQLADLREKSFKAALARITGKTDRGEHTTVDNTRRPAIQNSIMKESSELMFALNNMKQYSDVEFTTMLTLTAEKFVEVEIARLSKKEGKPTAKADSVSTNFYKDPFRSYLRQYVYVEPHKSATFDDMMRELRPYIERTSKYQYFKALWEVKHSGAEFKI